MKLIIFIVCTMFVSISNLAAQQVPTSWHFDTDTVGKIAQGFTNEEGEWKVVADDTAFSAPNVLAQMARNSGSTFNMTLHDESYDKDGEVSVMMKSVSGEEDQGGGIVWRARDANNYYIARYNPLEDNYRVYKVVNGKRIQLQSARIKHSDGWHLLQVKMIGECIECYYDKKKYLEITDKTFQGPGKVGLWTKADAVTYFDDLVVQEIK
ncbi:MAG: hypothetical protein E3K37_16860 [Candidatus Kuenenia sp.]|nr:hypothetical protein [Candidatus Kuenenia hertensis]